VARPGDGAVNKQLALRAVAHRNRIPKLLEQEELKANMFMQAFQGAKGIGADEGAGWKEWGTADRIRHAQIVTWYALNEPVWRDKLKHWKGRETDR
jgi:hypothetical protein